MVNTKVKQLTEADISLLLEQSPAIRELIQISAQCSPQGRTELLNIITRTLQASSARERAGGHAAAAPAATQNTR